MKNEYETKLVDVSDENVKVKKALEELEQRLTDQLDEAKTALQIQTNQFKVTHFYNYYITSMHVN